MNTIGTNRLRIYDLFYNKPLCDYIHDEKLNVLIIGNGWVGNEAFKAAFWCGLYPNTKLNITIASQNAKEYETTIKKYLPGINEFADFNGEIKSKYHYANIDIKEVSFDKIKDAGITDNVCNFLNIFDQDYIIVSVGDEEINFLVAETLAECLQKSSKKHIINVFTNIAANNVFENIEVNPIGTRQNDFANILSMAKNTNFAYIMQNAGYSSVDINNVNRHFDEEFNDEFIASPIESNEMQQSITNFCGENYNVDSSIANALHIKYKLKYCQEQQKNIVDVINKKGNVYNTLIAWEHRRWNAFMTIRGFRQPKESEKSSLDFRGKNADKRLHICLCECGDNGILLDENPQLWELEDISALPELEKASIYCYRALKKYVKDENRIQKIYNDIDFLIKSTNAEIREMIEKYKKAVEMLFAEENNAYKLYENIFNGILKRIGNNKKASDKLLSIDKLLEPIRQT